jgi:hypothetical protein
MPCDPGQNFVASEAPIFAEAIGGEAVRAAFAQMSIHPRHRNLEKSCDFLNGQELIVRPVLALTLH